MLFPDALHATRGCWRSVNYGSKNVGIIANSKERLRRDLRPKKNANECPDYIERDSVKLASKVLELQIDMSLMQPKSDSSTHFILQ